MLKIYINVDAAFYPILHESFSNSYGVAILQHHSYWKLLDKNLIHSILSQYVMMVGTFVQS